MGNNPAIPMSHQTCRVCSVSIDAKDRAHFSFGASASRERLYARVCQFTDSHDCLNRSCDLKNINPVDCYGTGEHNREEFEKLQSKITPKVA